MRSRGDVVSQADSSTSLREFDPTDLEELRSFARDADGAGSVPDLRSVRIGEAELDSLGESLETEGIARRPVVLVMDQSEIFRRGTPIKPEISSVLRHCTSERLQIEALGNADHPPHAGMTEAQDLAFKLPVGGVVVALGSGTITDLTKHAVFLAEKATASRMTLVCVPTACTVTAYTCPLAVLTKDGVKRTTPSRGPDHVWVDLQLVADAPASLTAAGFGDMMARCVAAGDWYLAHQLGLDPKFSTPPLDLLAHAETMLFEHAESIGRGDLVGIRHLVNALLLGGMAMSIAAQTAPISGWEHTISHYLDLRHLARNQPLGLHGAQVGAASLIAARAYADLFACGPERLSLLAHQEEASARNAIEGHFAQISDRSELSAELWRDYHTKWSQWRGDRGASERFDERWSSPPVRDRLRALVREPQQIEQALRRAGAPLDLAISAGCDTDVARDAVRYAHLVRRRFTLGDLLDALGWLTDANLDRWMTGSTA